MIGGKNMRTIKIIIIACLLAIMCSTVACNMVQKHIHSYGDWYVAQEAICTSDGVKERTCECGEKETQSIPAPNEHAFVNGECDTCGTTVIALLGNIIKNSPDKYTSGAYIKSFACNTFSSEKWAINHGLGFAYNENTNTLLIQLIDTNSVCQVSLTVTINNGVIARSYDYSYSNTNYLTSYTDKISGVFDASTLSTTSKFKFNDFSAGSGDAFLYLMESYQNEAASFTKKLFSYLDEFLVYQNLPFTSKDLNVK